MDTTVLVYSVILSLGVLANLILALCLKHTWRHWTQTKWYVLILTVGNWVEVSFTLTMLLAFQFFPAWEAGDFSCKLLMSLNDLGPSVANMAAAAMSLHVLLTSITGCPGTRTRHVLVIGLFLLLSLPFPLSRLVTYEVKTYGVFDMKISICTDREFFSNHEVEHLRLYYSVAGSVSLIFFPLVVLIGAIVGALILSCTASRATAKPNSNKADVGLITSLGIILITFCVPLQGYMFHFKGETEAGPQNIFLDLGYLFYSKVIASAIVCVVVGYVHMNRRDRREEDERTQTRGETQRLCK